MRFKSIILALNLSALAAAPQAQMLTPAKPVVAAPAAPATQAPTAAPNAPASPAAQATATATAPQTGALAPGVISLSDVAKQSGPAPAATSTQPIPVPAITVAEGTGQPIELARDKMHLSITTRTPNTSPISLVRITRVGGDDTAVLWIKGQHRKVTTGSRVLQYAVGEIKDDGVCLYEVKGNGKDKCKKLLTFQGM